MVMVLTNGGRAMTYRLFAILARVGTNQEWWRVLSPCWKCTIPFGYVHRSIRWLLFLFLFRSWIHNLRSIFGLLSPYTHLIQVAQDIPLKMDSKMFSLGNMTISRNVVVALPILW